MYLVSLFSLIYQIINVIFIAIFVYFNYQKEFVHESATAVVVAAAVVLSIC